MQEDSAGKNITSLKIKMKRHNGEDLFDTTSDNNYYVFLFFYLKIAKKMVQFLLLFQLKTVHSLKTLHLLAVEQQMQVNLLPIAVKKDKLFSNELAILRQKLTNI